MRLFVKYFILLFIEKERKKRIFLEKYYKYDKYSIHYSYSTDKPSVYSAMASPLFLPKIKNLKPIPCAGYFIGIY